MKEIFEKQGDPASAVPFKVDLPPDFYGNGFDSPNLSKNVVALNWAYFQTQPASVSSSKDQKLGTWKQDKRHLWKYGILYVELSWFNGADNEDMILCE